MNLCVQIDYNVLSCFQMSGLVCPTFFYAVLTPLFSEKNYSKQGALVICNEKKERGSKVRNSLHSFVRYIWVRPCI
jgi:hypothetical protein